MQHVSWDYQVSKKMLALIIRCDRAPPHSQRRRAAAKVEAATSIADPQIAD
jgi:hypothetical protein